MEKKTDENKIKTLEGTDQIGEFEPSVMPIAPDGGIVPGAFAAPGGADVPRDFEVESMCASASGEGPCRHYWRLVTPVDTMAPETYAELGLPEPKQITRSCLAHAGTETQLSGDLPILECNRFQPFTPAEKISARVQQTNKERKKSESSGDES